MSEEDALHDRIAALERRAVELEAGINGRAAETGALQSLLGLLMVELALSSPAACTAVANAFDRSANHMTAVASRYGDRAPPEHTLKALQIVEQLRAAVVQRLRDDPRPGPRFG